MVVITLTSEFEEYAKSLGVDKVAYTTIDPEYVTDEMYPNTIVAIVKMDDELLGVEPDRSLKQKYKELYVVMTDLMVKLCDFIEERGYNTYMIDQLDRTINFSVVAQKAIMGYIGNNKLLITEDIGAGHKIILITTDMPVDECDDSIDEIKNNVTSTCKMCFRCVKNCPDHALYVKDDKIFFDRKKCIGYTHGCTFCIVNCPFQMAAEVKKLAQQKLEA